MNRKAFTLVELLGVIVILSVIMLIAIPNVTSVLEKTKRDNYIADAKRFVSLVEYELRSGDLNKPTSSQLLKISLNYLKTPDVNKDPDNNVYDKQNSYVVVARINGYLEYYVNLVSVDDKGNTKGISLINIDELDKDNRYERITTNLTTLNDSAIKNKVGLSSATLIKK